MAEVTAMRNNALPYPVYGAPWTVVFPMLDADGDLVTGATTPDAEVSKNGDTFADCTNESTEIATASGMYYLTLTGTEMTADIVAVIAKSATAGMKTTALTFYPRKLVTIRSGTAASGGVSTSTIVLDGSASAVDDFYNGMLCVATIDTLVEARIITDYTGSNQTATVVPDWNVAPDNNDTFVIYLPEGVQIKQANTTAWNGTAVASPHTAGYPVVTVKDGTGTGEINTNAGAIALVDLVTTTTTATTATNVTTVNGLANNVITAASIAADAITAAKIADGAIDAATFAAGAINAAAIAADAIGASELAADAVAEIADQVWDEVLAGHLTAGSTGNALNAAGSAGDPWSTALPGAYGAGTAGHIIGTALPDIAAGASGGLLISGSNSGTTTLGALTVTGATTLTGNVSLGGTLGITGTTTLAALTTTGTVTFNALTVSNAFTVNGGATFTSSTGNGFTCTSSGSNGHGISAIGNGTGSAIFGTAGATGDGLTLRGGVTSGAGAHIHATTSGDGLVLESHGGGVGLLVDTVTVSGAITATNASNDIRGVKLAATGLASIAAWTVAITGNITGNLSGSIGSLATQAKADVNAEVVDCLNTDTYAQPGQGTPAATTTIVSQLGYLYKTWRNKTTQTATTFSVYNDDTTTVDQKATCSDDTTTFTKGEIATGP